MHSVFRELRRRDIRVDECRALEVFGGNGGFHTIDYAAEVRSLDIWEHDPACDSVLRQGFPRATVRICDSYSALRSEPKKFDLIVVDNPSSRFGRDNVRCEHFDLVHDLFRVAAPSSVVILNVIPSVPESVRRKFPYIFDQHHLNRRAAFYGSSTPERIPVIAMIPVYERFIRDAGFELRWWFSRRRHYAHYLVLKVNQA